MYRIGVFINYLIMILLGMLFGYIITIDCIRKDCESIGKANVLKNKQIICKIIQK